jgi:hypothetical protein
MSTQGPIANVTVWGLLGLGVGATLGGAAWDQVGKGAAVGAAIGVALGALTNYGQGTAVSGFPQVGAGGSGRAFTPSPQQELAELERQLAKTMPASYSERGQIEWLKQQAAYRSQWAQLKHKLGEDPDIDFTDDESTYPSRENISGLAIDEAFADVGRRLHGSFRATGYKMSPRGFAGWRRPMTHAPRIRRRRSPYGT